MVCHENHPTCRLLRGPLRTRFDREAVPLRRQWPPARDLAEDDQETSFQAAKTFAGKGYTVETAKQQDRTFADARLSKRHA
jgi:hypothetical protein